ncbi:MAG: geranylgeranylglycerol-phosphate geranylgeranyltransferase [Candidatus Hydrothermarchaeota archaeon]
MQGYIRIIRPLNCFLAGTLVVIGIIITGKLDTVTMTIAFSVAFLITGAGNTINDYFDIEIDKINNPERPIPSGEIKEKHALMLAILLFLAGIGISLKLTFICIIIAVFNSALLIFYSYKLKRKGFIGNLSISYLGASTLIFGGASVEKFTVPFILSLLAFFSTLSRELIKDIEDIHGDRCFASTLPLLIGEEKTSLIASLFLAFSVLLSPLPYFLNIFGIRYLILVFIADLVFLYSILILLTGGPETAGKVSSYLKLGMIIAVIAFLFG